MDARPTSAACAFDELSLPDRGKRIGCGPSPISADRLAAAAGRRRFPALTQGVELAGHDVTLDSHAGGVAAGAEMGPAGRALRQPRPAVSEHGDLLRPYLSRAIVDPQADKFAALHAACWSGGTCCTCPGAWSIDQPLHMLSVFRRRRRFRPRPGRAGRGRRGDAAGRNGRHRRGGRRLALRGHRAVGGPGARLRYVNLQNWGTGVWHFAHQKALVDRDGRCSGPSAPWAAGWPRSISTWPWSGRGAEAQVNGVMFTEGRQHLSYHTLQHHQAVDCRSDLLYKGALQDKSRIVWRGMIKVDRDAQKTDGYQRERQPDALRTRPGRFDSRAWKSRPTTCAARTARRPAGWTTSWFSTPAPAA